MSKQYIAKVYSFPSGNLLGTLNSKRLGPVPFSSRINQGQGQLRFTYVLDFDAYDEDLFRFMNLLRIYVVDDANPLGRILYTGWISQIEPFAQGSKQGIDITLLGVGSLMQNAYYKNPGRSFTLTGDPGQLLRNLVDNFNSVYEITNNFPGGVVFYEDGDIEDTGDTVTVEIDDRTWADAMNTIFSFTPANWFFRIEGDGRIVMREKPASATHTFTFGKDINSLSIPKNIEKVKNKIYVRDSLGVETSYQDSASIALYGLREVVSSAPTDSSADVFGGKSLDEKKGAKTAGKIEVDVSYDIESIKPGDTCSVRNLRFGADLLPDNLTIVSVGYSPSRASLVLEQDVRLADEILTLTNG